jgi:DNA-binding NarL/FixJ family response regulator
MARPRIVLAEDNPEMHQRLAQLLGSHFALIASVTDGEQAIQASLQLKPDILVTDISMPVYNGLEVASRLRDLECPTKLIFVTVHDDDDYRDAASSLGAFGYVLKCRIDIDLIPAIECALEGTKLPWHFTASRN